MPNSKRDHRHGNGNTSDGSGSENKRAKQESNTTSSSNELSQPPFESPLHPPGQSRLRLQTQFQRQAQVDPNMNYHPHFYFSDGNLVIKVEDTLYKLHRSVLAKLNPTGTLSIVKDDPAEGIPGSSDSRPLLLSSNLKKPSFEVFLSMLYPLANPEWTPPKELTFPQWKPLVAFAKLYGISFLLHMCKHDVLSKLPPKSFNRISFCEILYPTLKYHQIYESLESLVTRKTPPTDAEARMLSGQIVGRLWRVRDMQSTYGVPASIANEFEFDDEQLLAILKEKNLSIQEQRHALTMFKRVKEVSNNAIEEGRELVNRIS